MNKLSFKIYRMKKKLIQKKKEEVKYRIITRKLFHMNMLEKLSIK